MFRSYGKAGVIAAVAAACGYAGAATLNVTASQSNVSLEGTVQRATESLQIGNVDLTMGAFQTRDSVIRLSLAGITGAKFASSGASSPSVSCTGGNMVLDVATNSAASSTWDFGIASTSGSTSALSCTFSSLAVSAGSLSSGGTLTITSAVKRVSDTDYTYDAAAAKTVLTVATQISSISVLSALNGVVDYSGQQGLGFDTDDGNATIAGNTDNLTIRVGSKSSVTLTATSALTVGFAIDAASGKTFAWLDDAAGSATPELNRTTSSGRVDVSAGTLTINADRNQLTFKATGVFTGTAVDYTIAFGHKTADPNPSTGVAIEPMTFPTVAARVEQGSTSRATANLTIGSWGSNGTTVKIPYLPINTTAGSTKIDPIIIVSNRSAVTGTVTVNVINSAGKSCAGSLGTISGNSTKSFGGALRTLLQSSTCSADFNTAAGESLNVSLTATLPDGSTEVFTGYNAESGRVTVVNDSNGKP